MISNSRIDKCGKILRSVHLGMLSERSPEYLSVVEDIEIFRAGFESPLSQLVLELEEIVKSHSFDFPVANRPKQINRIGKKLLLQPKMRLSQMDDLGGCRIVATSPENVALLAGSIRERFEVHSESDYRLNPRSSGYRALHIIVKFQNHKIEVQLRTVRQHTWAELVETLDKRYPIQLKDEDGPIVLRKWLLAASNSFSELDMTGEASESARNELATTTRLAVEWMSEADNESN